MITNRQVDEFLNYVNGPTAKALAEVGLERARQHNLWGDQTDVPDGTGPCALWYGSNYFPYGDDIARKTAKKAIGYCQWAAKAGVVTWLDILIEEVSEALAEDDPQKLRTELVQVAAVAVQWIEAIDTRNHQ